MNKKINIHAILLAAGLSRRMGKDNKLLLPYQEHTLLGEVLTQLSQTDINGITLVTGHEREEVEKAVEGFDVSICFNPDYAKGQSSSIQAGVKNLSTEVDGFLICLGDMPKISTAHYQKLIDDFRNLLLEKKAKILRPFQKGQPGHPVCFAGKYQTAILEAEEEDGCRQVILGNLSDLVEWETEEGAYFFDVDTRENYEGESGD